MTVCRERERELWTHAEKNAELLFPIVTPGLFSAKTEKDDALNDTHEPFIGLSKVEKRVMERGRES